jgi:LysR family hydrogen peroxide-inducible transcriptional activator
MELHQLRYFAAVADAGSFTRAAERCFVSQPSLSQQVIKLEEEIGRPLIERLGRKVKLTDAGRALYERATRILAAVEEARQSARSSDDWMAGHASIGAILTVAPYLLPDVVRDFSARFPQAQLTVREGFTEELVKDCLTGELDVALAALPIHDERLEVEPLFSEELLLAAPPGHPVLAKKRITLADFSGLPFVLLNEIHCLGDQIISFCRQHNCLPVVTCKTAQLLTVQEMVALGQGASLVPEMAANRDGAMRRMYRSLGTEAPRRTIVMMWRRDRHRSPLVEQLVAALRKAYGRSKRRTSRRVATPANPSS